MAGDPYVGDCPNVVLNRQSWQIHSDYTSELRRIAEALERIAEALEGTSTNTREKEEPKTGVVPIPKAPVG